MLGREVVKVKQDFFIFVEAFAGFWEFGLVTSGHKSLRIWDVFQELGFLRARA